MKLSAAALLGLFLVLQRNTATAQPCFGEFSKIQPEDTVIMEEARAELSYRPSFYKDGDHRFFNIQQRGAVVGWILGTMHARYLQLVYLPMAVHEAFLLADVLIQESTADDLNKFLNTTENRREIRRRATIPVGQQSLEDMAVRDPDFINNLGVLHFALDVLGRKTVSEISDMLHRTGCATTAATFWKPESEMDSILFAWSVANDMEELGLEDPADTVFAALSEAEQARTLALLPLYARRAPNAPGLFNFKVRQYLAGRIDLLMAADNVYMTTPQDREVLAQEFEVNVTRRNLQYPRKIANEIERGRKPFVAIGAAHLIGEQGLIAGLQDLGYSVIPIDLPPSDRVRGDAGSND